jgi:hypothetical protein
VEGREAEKITGVCDHPVRLQDPGKPCHIRTPKKGQICHEMNVPTRARGVERRTMCERAARGGQV